MKQRFWRLITDSRDRGENGDLGERGLWFVSPFENKDLALFAAHDEALRVGPDRFYVESVHVGVLVEHRLVVSVGLAVNDVTLVSAHQELAVRQPAVARVVAADVLVFLVEVVLHRGQSVGLCNFVELVRLGTRDQHQLGVYVAEGDLGTQNVRGSLGKHLLGNALGLVPLPNVDVLLRDAGQGDNLFFVLGAERDTDEFLVLLFKLCARNDLFAFKGLEVVDDTDRSPLCFFGDCKELLAAGDGESCDGFGALGAGNVPLGLFFHIVEDDVVADGVADSLVVDEVEIAVHVRFDTGKELGHEDDVGGVFGLGDRLEVWLV